MTAVAVDIRHRPGKLTAMARALSQDHGVGEVFVRGAFNKQKAEWLKWRGHDPLATTTEWRANARRLIREGLATADAQLIRQSLLRAAQYLVQRIRERITTGMLGTNTAVTRKIKHWKVMHGLATARYGDPPPYGVETGHMVHSMIAKWRPGRGTR